MLNNLLTPGRTGLRALMIGIFCGVVMPAGAVRAQVMPVGSIEQGMKGYGLTVFRGGRIDTFAVTVVGVQERSRVDGNMILVDVAGHGLETSGIAQGMSGSPIFLNGRLAGALAFGWGGSLRPLAGVTPAGEMLALPTDEVAPAVVKLAVPGPGQLVAPGAADQLARVLGWDAPADIPYGLPGWPAADRVLKEMAPELDAAAGGRSWPTGWFQVPPGRQGAGAAGGGDRSPGARLVPGAACAIPLVMGDALLGVIGTTTWVEGDDVFMMGHPFLQRGPVRWPLATAKVLTVLPSRQMSFKMAGIGSLVGTVYHDQRAGLTGRLGPAPRMIPVAVNITGGDDDRAYTFQVADDQALAPSLVFWCLYNSLLVGGDDASQQTIRYRLVSRWRGDPGLEARPLELEGVAVGPGGARGLAAAWMAPLAMLLNNPERPLVLEDVRAEVAVSRPVSAALITDLDGPREVEVAGGRLVCRVQLQPRREASRSLEVTLDLPDYLRPGPYRLVAASEAALFALEVKRLGSEPRTDTLADVLKLLRMPRSADKLTVALVAQGGGLVVRGREMRSLPGSKARLLKIADPEARPPVAWIPARTTVPVAWALDGAAVMDVNLVGQARGFQAHTRP